MPYARWSKKNCRKLEGWLLFFLTSIPGHRVNDGQNEAHVCRYPDQHSHDGATEADEPVGAGGIPKFLFIAARPSGFKCRDYAEQRPQKRYYRRQTIIMAFHG